jgi:hypothetical protein
MFLLDTNVVSELRKVRLGKADPQVSLWADRVSPAELFLSVIVIREIEIGIRLAERRDPTHRRLPHQSVGDVNPVRRTERLRPGKATTLNESGGPNGESECAGTVSDRQAVKHLVMAELIDREQVPESPISVRKVPIDGRQRATVRASVFGPAARFTAKREYRCELERESGRWVLRQVRPDSGSANPQ